MILKKQISEFNFSFYVITQLVFKECKTEN